MKISHKVIGFGGTLLLAISILMGCNAQSQQAPHTKDVPLSAQTTAAAPEKQQSAEPLHEVGAIQVPQGYDRTDDTERSFGSFLRGLPLKAEGSPVMLYNGDEKWNQEAHFAVINLPIGKRDLHQCADAVMRIRADYLRKRGRHDDIHFNFVSGFNCEYQKWMQGYRVKVSGNKVTWYKGAEPGNSDASYWKYLEMVWSYAGTLSLEKELQSKPTSDLAIGDVWIRGGSPGHAILVIDVVVNSAGEKLFLLAQSYMPAQEMHVLKNPGNAMLSPWYEIPDGDLVTPEWTFKNTQLRAW